MKLEGRYAKLFVVCFVIVSITTVLIITQNDPVEKVREKQDEVLQSNAAEFIQATVLYYSIHTGLPWFAAEENGVNCFENNTQIATVPMTTIEPCVQVLIGDNALRDDFIRSSRLDALFVSNPNPNTQAKLDTIVCFQPQSKRWQRDDNTKFGINGMLSSENRCHSQGGSEFCYWCTQ